MTPSRDAAHAGRLRTLTDEYLALAGRLQLGGGAKRAARMHEKGQLSPRERVERLLDPKSTWVELGLLMAYDQYDGQAPGAGVIIARLTPPGHLGSGHRCRVGWTAAVLEAYLTSSWRRESLRPCPPVPSGRGHDH